MIVISYNTIDQGRGNGLVMTMKRITDLFANDLDQMKNCTGILVTKVGGDIELEDLIENIEDICKSN